MWFWAVQTPKNEQIYVRNFDPFFSARTTEWVFTDVLFDQPNLPIYVNITSFNLPRTNIVGTESARCVLRQPRQCRQRPKLRQQPLPW
jgi:hypothetical protein